MGEYDAAPSKRVGDLMDSVLGADLAGRLNDTQRAARAWFSVAGKLEREHTMGLFVHELAGRAPELIVYVDSNAIAQDLMTNRDLYVARMEYAGYEVSDVQFKLSRRRRERRGQEEEQPEEQLPELDAEEMAQVDTLVPASGDSLDEAIRTAMIWSLRREKALRST